jgi:hypothetical protein
MLQVGRTRYESRGGDWIFFTIYLVISRPIMAIHFTHPLTEISTRGRRVRLKTLPQSASLLPATVAFNLGYA